MLYVMPLLDGTKSLADITSKAVRSGVFFKGIEDNDYVEIIHDAKKPHMREDIVRVGNFPNKKPMLRYRPGYKNWKAVARVEFMKHLITAEQVLLVLDQAGACAGICEWRPEKNGTFGRFRVIQAMPAKLA
jgi:hypothetical protein